ncbi:MAG: recombinase family protein [Fibrobacter sp.]|nr:recombinase family protein [Fibrobacter sp.]
MAKTKKCILLVRVSTVAQSFDEQERELYEMALQYGYSHTQIVPIAEKESGIKLDEEERAGLNRMKELIATDEYDCVFAWEISRIARRKKILFSILEYLTERGIQLVIKEPKIELLNPDGTINEGSETIFTLFCQIAESEMRNKQARFARTKKDAYAKGKYMGGKIKLGYKVNDDGFWVVDDEGAKLVRMIFEMYNSGEYSLTKLATELREQGYFQTVKNVSYTKCMIWKILKDEAYIGGKTEIFSQGTFVEIVNGKRIETKRVVKKRTSNTYPRIIDDETWQRCVEKRKANKCIIKGQYQYLLTPIIHCKCGASYCVDVKDASYICRVRHNAVEKGLSHDPSIKINMIESLAWFVALQELQIDSAKNKGKVKEEYEKEIALLTQKIEHSKTQIENAQEKRSELDEAYYVKSRFTLEKYESLAAKQNKVIEDERANILKHEKAIRNLRKLLESQTTYDELINSVTQSYKELRHGMDFESMKKIVHRYIKSIEIKPVDGKPTNLFKKIIIHTTTQNISLERFEDIMRFESPFNNVFYVDSMRKKAYYDEAMTSEVPMVYLNRLAPRYLHTTRNGKNVTIRINN